MPDDVDSSTMWVMYKPHPTDDVTLDFFCKPDEETIIKPGINFDWDSQFTNYHNLDFDGMNPLLKKYFTPSTGILEIKNFLIDKYDIDIKNTIAVYYRGTDKKSETKLASYNSFYEKIDTLAKKYPQKKILLQTDTAQFVDYLKTKEHWHRVFMIDENFVSYEKNGIHNERTFSQNHSDMYYLFATFLIQADCMDYICSSGNCSIWTVLYRGSGANVYQFLNNVWYIHKGQRIVQKQNIKRERYLAAAEQLANFCSK
jgi:hypothetical protein